MPLGSPLGLRRGRRLMLSAGDVDVEGERGRKGKGKRIEERGEGGGVPK